DRSVCPAALQIGRGNPETKNQPLKLERESNLRSEISNLRFRSATRNVALFLRKRLYFRRYRVFEMRGLAQRHAAHNLKLETFKGCDFGGMVRQQLYTTEPKVMKYLSANSVIPVRSVSCFKASFALAYRFLLHQRVGAQLIYQIETMFALAQIKNHALAGGGNFFQGCM